MPSADFDSDGAAVAYIAVAAVAVAVYPLVNAMTSNASNRDAAAACVVAFPVPYHGAAEVAAPANHDASADQVVDLAA